MKLEIAEPARLAALSAARWYDDAEPGLGDEFIAAVFDAAALISAGPHAWPIWPGIRQASPPIRRYVMARFPFSIGFQVFDDRVVVLAIDHAKRRPGHWR